MEPTSRQTSQSKKIAVIACTKQKRPSAARAIELYDRSPLFRLCVAAARREGYPVLILSTKYGLVEADERVEPYEADLRHMSAADRSVWQTEIAKQAQTLIAGSFQEVVCFAGQDYRHVVQAVCGPLGVRVSTYPGWRRICDEAFGAAEA